VTDLMREMIATEERRGDQWKTRAESAEHWWASASALLADISRRVTLPEAQMTAARELLKWEPSCSSFKPTCFGEDHG
jgi:hypothetical protein